MSLELMVLGSVFSEGQFDKVSFLYPDDFTDKYYGFFWDCIKRNEGDVLKAMADLEFNQRKDLSKQIFTYSMILGDNNITKIALNIVELRFKKLLTCLLGKLSNDSINALERDILSEYKEAIKEHDIFVLNDGMLEYFGHQISDYSRNRINDYLKYVDKRIENIKEVTNGVR